MSERERERERGSGWKKGERERGESRREGWIEEPLVGIGLAAAVSNVSNADMCVSSVVYIDDEDDDDDPLGKSISFSRNLFPVRSMVGLTYAPKSQVECGCR